MGYFARFAVPHASPAIYASMIAIGVTVFLILFGLTHFKKWIYLWSEWLTTVDHKKIGTMYLISALLMLFRGGVDALMMRAQTAVPDNKLLDSQHYNEVFSTHGVMMIIFMAMPYIMAFMNIRSTITDWSPRCSISTSKCHQFLVIFYGCDAIQHLFCNWWFT